MSIDIAPYQNLLRTVRIRPSPQGDRPSVVQSGSDRGRIVFSSAFRRLQQKAQVFPLDRNDAVRTRLTHSLEVAHTGRYLAQEILFRLSKASGKAYLDSWLFEHEQVFTDIVEAACLIHDIGNPPFGHFGEAAIRDWFVESGRAKFRWFAKRNGVDKSAVDQYLAGEYLDFLAFDGNPQGLRLVTKLQGDDGATALNLTLPLLMAYLKYTCLPDSSKLVNPAGISKKPGFFSTEADIIDKAIAELGMKSGARHPLSYIMEAADDISYCMSEIEDGIEKGVINVDRLFADVAVAWKKKREDNPKLTENFVDDLIKKSKEVSAIGAFTTFKTTIINTAVKHAAKVYCADHEEMISGCHKGLIRGESDIVSLFGVIKDFVRRTVFRSREAESVELAGYSTIKGLFDCFSPLLMLPPETFKGLVHGKNDDNQDYCLRLVNKLSEKSRAVYKVGTRKKLTPEQEWHLRAHLLVDYISGMTDHFAVSTYQLLAGIKIET